MLDIFCFSYPPFWVLSAQVNMVNVGSYLHSSCQTQMGFKLQIPYMLCCGFIMQIVQLQCSYPLLASLFMWFRASISNIHVILWILSVHAKVLELIICSYFWCMNQDNARIFFFLLFILCHYMQGF